MSSNQSRRQGGSGSRWGLALGVMAAVSAFMAQAADGAAPAGIIAQWRFAPERTLGDDVKPMFGGPDISFAGSARFVKDPAPPRVELPGTDESLTVATDVSKALLPQQAMTVESWVRIDQIAARGGILGVFPADNDVASGWVLGYTGDRFSFALGTTNRAERTTVTAPTPLETNRWYHVAATYDGSLQSLFVNGALVASNTLASGPIATPKKGSVLAAAMRAGAESLRLKGALHEISLYRRALPLEELRSHHESRRAQFPEPAPVPARLKLAYGPFVDWETRRSARVTWETDQPMPTRLVLEGPGGVVQEYTAPTVGMQHAVVLTDLKPNIEYYYRIHAPVQSGVPVQTRRYLFDTSFYYEPVAAAPAATDSRRSAGSMAELAGNILKQTGARDGYCFVLGAMDGTLALELARQSRMDIVVVEKDPARIAAARKTLSAAGLYGVRASVHRQDGDTLPYGSLVANLVVSESALESGRPPGVTAAEAVRLVRPVGGALVLGSPKGSGSEKTAWTQWTQGTSLATASLTTKDGLWLTYTRGRLPGAGDWSHQYGSTDNTSCSQDELVRGDLQVAWWGDPGPRPMPDRGNRNPAPLSVDGRLYVQGNRILFGLDAYNGAILWSLSTPEVRRANVTRDCSNMAAAGDRLYVAHGRYCVALDGQTGARAQRYAVLGDEPAGSHDWGYIAVAKDWLIGSRQKGESTYLGDDGEWYEDFVADQTSRVTSDQLFSLDPATGKTRWVYTGGILLNSTITIGDGQILFIESRSPEAMAATTSRIPHDKLTDQYLVALDIRTGKRLWDKAQDFSKCEYMTYLVYSQHTAVVTGTDRNKNFHTFAFAAPAPNRSGGDDLEGAIPGRMLWSDTHKEDKGHHSGHLQHPLIIGTTFYSDQRSFDLVSGQLLRKDLPERRGCGVMSAGRNAVFFRHHFHGMWDLATDKRTQFEGIRTGCWLGLIPAGGMLLAPESSAGCSCTHAIQTSVGYLPKSLTLE